MRLYSNTWSKNRTLKNISLIVKGLLKDLMHCWKPYLFSGISQIFSMYKWNSCELSSLLWKQNTYSFLFFLFQKWNLPFQLSKLLVITYIDVTVCTKFVRLTTWQVLITALPACLSLPTRCMFQNDWIGNVGYPANKT